MAVSYLTFYHNFIVLFFVSIYVYIYIYMFVCFECFCLIFNIYILIFILRTLIVLVYNFILMSIFIAMYVSFWVFCIILFFCVLFVCKCALFYCHTVSTHLQLNISNQTALCSSSSSSLHTSFIPQTQF